MKKILIDTNFLLIPGQFKVDIFSELNKFSTKLFILDKTIDELKKIKGKHKKAANLALKLTKKIKIIKTHSNKSVDPLILETAKKGYAVATQDIALKRKLKQNKTRVITLRQKKYLILS